MDRSNKEFLYCIYGEAIKAGATTITFADTVGYNFPSEVGQFITDMKANIVGIEHAVISVHCHNDLGLAIANTISVSFNFLLLAVLYIQCLPFLLWIKFNVYLIALHLIIFLSLFS
jgi:hypothetical protein